MPSPFSTCTLLINIHGMSSRLDLPQLKQAAVMAALQCILCCSAMGVSVVQRTIPAACTGVRSSNQHHAAAIFDQGQP